MTLSIKNCGYAVLIKLHLCFLCYYEKSSNCKKILDDLSVKLLITLILHENDEKFLKLKGSPI